MAIVRLLVTAVVAVLAVARATNMFVLEEGPFGVFALIRRIDAKQKTWIGRGLNCVMCVSFWTALGATVLLYLVGAPLSGSFVIDWLGIAGAYAILRARGYLY